jgi:hypothetical protein
MRLLLGMAIVWGALTGNPEVRIVMRWDVLFVVVLGVAMVRCMVLLEES